MRIRTIVLARLALSTTVLAQAPASALPYDPYPWCAGYGGRMSGSSSCGFSIWNQCMATVSGIGGFCQRNSFYNPRASASRSRKRAYYNY
ncbi:MAG: DUF3551 domain-containing protein [Pseudolabrys sp.]